MRSLLKEFNKGELALLFLAIPIFLILLSLLGVSIVADLSNWGISSLKGTTGYFAILSVILLLVIVGKIDSMKDHWVGLSFRVPFLRREYIYTVEDPLDYYRKIIDRKVKG